MSAIGLIAPLIWLLTASAPKPLAVAGVPFGSISHPASSWQVDEQQSLLAVLPSSHCSAPTLRPSPQIAAQTLGAPAQVKPLCTVQVAEQPSPAVTLPSSQASAP